MFGAEIKIKCVLTQAKAYATEVKAVDTKISLCLTLLPNVVFQVKKLIVLCYEVIFVQR